MLFRKLPPARRVALRHPVEPARVELRAAILFEKFLPVDAAIERQAHQLAFQAKQQLVQLLELLHQLLDALVVHMDALDQADQFVAHRAVAPLGPRDRIVALAHRLQPGLLDPAQLFVGLRDGVEIRQHLRHQGGFLGGQRHVRGGVLVVLVVLGRVAGSLAVLFAAFFAAFFAALFSGRRNEGPVFVLRAFGNVRARRFVRAVCGQNGVCPGDDLSDRRPVRSRDRFRARRAIRRPVRCGTRLVVVAGRRARAGIAAACIRTGLLHCRPVLRIGRGLARARAAVASGPVPCDPVFPVALFRGAVRVIAVGAVFRRAAERRFEIDDVAQQNRAVLQRIAPGDDGAHGERAFAQAADHLLPAGLDAFGDFDLAFAGQQLDRAHLAQIHAHRIVGPADVVRDVALALGRLAGAVRLLLVRAFGIDHVDAHHRKAGQNVFALFVGDPVGRNGGVDLLFGEIALLLAFRDQLLFRRRQRIDQRIVGIVLRFGGNRLCRRGLACHVAPSPASRGAGAPARTI